MKAPAIEFIQRLAYARLEQLHAGDEQTPVQKGVLLLAKTSRTSIHDKDHIH